MEHIVQFGITIDDEEIKRIITNKAADTVVNEVRKELGVGKLPGVREIERIVQRELDNLFSTYKDEIIIEAGKQLADKMIRTKAVKDAVGKVLEEVGVK